MTMTMSPWFRSEKPTRPYKNMYDMAQKVAWQSHRQWPLDKWPCLTCGGVQTIYDPNDPPCPIDGNRGRRQITCTSCAGTGECHRAVFLDAYRAAIRNWKIKRDAWMVRFRTWKKLQKRLTPEERIAIHEFGVGP